MINEQRRIVQEDVVQCFVNSNYNGYALVPTGSGKAWIFIELLKKLNPKTVWYLSDSELNRDVTFKAELKKWGGEEFIDRINFMCYQTASKLKGEKVELLLADEFDFALTPKYSRAYTENHFKYKVLLSGTLDGKKKKKAEEIAPMVFSMGVNEAEDDGVLNKTTYYVVNYLLTKPENKRYLGYSKRFRLLLNGSRDRSALEMLQIQRKHFLSNLTSSVNICRKLLKHLYANKDNKILIFCGLSEQADAVCKFSYHSKNESAYLKAFDRDDIRVLAVVSKIDRGVNLHGVNCIVFESPSKSSTKFSQRTGRGRRLKIQDMLTVYFLVPYFTDRMGRIRPTVVQDWIETAAKHIHFKPKVFKFHD